MTTSTCPEGHESEADDWCDVCGAQIDAADRTAAAPSLAPPPSASDADSSSTPAASPRATVGSGSVLDLDAPTPEIVQPQQCANCGSEASGDALFCESCGYDFTTGQLPEPTPTLPGSIVPDPAAVPATAPASDAETDDGAGPEWVAEIWVDPAWYAAQESEDADPCPSSGPPKVVHLTGPTALVGRRSKSRNIHPEIECGSDSSVSRRQAEFTLDDHRWFLEDLGSTNGTFAGSASGPLPVDPLEPGQRHELGENDRVYVGAWTRIVVRPATAQERRP